MIIGLSGYIGCGKDTVGMILQALTMQEGSRWKTIPLEYVTAYGGRPNLKGGWRIKKFAGKLKEIATMLTGIPVEKFEDQEFKKTFLDKQWDQWRVSWKHGDDGPGSATFKTEEEAIKFIEDGFEDSVEDIRSWGHLTFEQMTVREFLQKLGTEGLRNNLHNQVWVNALFSDYKEGDNLIITDVRFPNEAKAIKDLGGVVVRIERMKTADMIAGPGGTQLHPSETSLDGWNFDYVINNNGTLQELLGATRTLLNNIEN